jgi:hypothetical protein
VPGDHSPLEAGYTIRKPCGTMVAPPMRSSATAGITWWPSQVLRATSVYRRVGSDAHPSAVALTVHTVAAVAAGIDEFALELGELADGVIGPGQGEPEPGMDFSDNSGRSPTGSSRTFKNARHRYHGAVDNLWEQRHTPANVTPLPATLCGQRIPVEAVRSLGQ